MRRNDNREEGILPMKVNKLVIVGGVAGGASAAAKARRCSEDVEIIMYEKGPDISYANCGLPYYLSGVIKKRDDLLITTAKFFRRRFKVDARTRTEVLSIDRQHKQITVKKLDTGEIEKEFYDRLMSISPPKRGLNRRRFLAYDIREQIKHRGRLRVRTEMDVFFQFQGSYLPSRVVNVSRGGLFMKSTALLPKGSRIKVYMPNLGSDYGNICTFIRRRYFNNAPP